MSRSAAGGWAALLAAAATLAYAAIAGLLLPGLGLSAPADALDPLKVMAARIASPGTFLAIGAVDALWGAACLVVALALYQRLRASAPLLTLLAVVCSAIFSASALAAPLVELLGYPRILAAQDTQAASDLNRLALGIGCAGAHAYGWGLLLFAWVSTRARALPLGLRALMVANGVVDLAVFAFLPLLLADLVLFTLWSAWLGALLLSRPPVTSR